MATEVLKSVSGNASQAVANDDFEAYQREANKADIESKFGKAAESEAVKPAAEKPKAAEPPKKGVGSLTHRELRARVRELEAKLSERIAAPVVEEPATVVDTEPEAQKPDQLRVRPKSDDKATDGQAKYKTWEEYEDDLLAWNTEKTIRALDERNAKLTQEQQIETINKTIEQSWRERVEKSRELHEDFDEVALDDKAGPGKLILPGSLVDEWLMDSEYGAELLYYFGQNPQELLKFEKIAGVTPSERRANARRMLVKIEDKITAGSKPKREPEPEREEEPRVTKTPKPSAEVGGRGNKLPDPVLAAVAGGTDADTGRYIDEQNRREIRAKFGDMRR